MHEVQFMTAGQIMHRQAQFMIGICSANSNSSVYLYLLRFVLMLCEFTYSVAAAGSASVSGRSK